MTVLLQVFDWQLVDRAGALEIVHAGDTISRSNVIGLHPPALLYVELSSDGTATRCTIRDISRPKLRPYLLHISRASGQQFSLNATIPFERHIHA